MKRPTLTLAQQKALQPVQPQAEIVAPKQTSYADLERKALTAGLAKLEENAPEWKRLRRSAGFAD